MSFLPPFLISVVSFIQAESGFRFQIFSRMFLLGRWWQAWISFGWILTLYFFWIKSQTWSVTETFRFCSSSEDLIIVCLLREVGLAMIIFTFSPLCWILSRRSPWFLFWSSKQKIWGLYNTCSGQSIVPGYQSILTEHSCHFSVRLIQSFAHIIPSA